MGNTGNMSALAGAAFASNGQMGLMKWAKEPAPVRVPPNAMFAALFLMLPVVLVLALGDEPAEAHAISTSSTLQFELNVS